MTKLFFLLTPFSYLDFAGVRFLIFQLLVGVLFCVKALFFKKRLLGEKSLYPLVLLLWLTFLYAFVSGVYEAFWAISSFALILCFSLQISWFLDGKNINRINRLYVWACIFTAVGLFVQWILHVFLNLTVFRYILFGGARNAYSFIWMDFSFISLYVISCIPMLFRLYSKKVSFLISGFLIFSSLITSARTGVAALFIFLAVTIFLSLLKAFFSRKIALKYLMYILFFPIILVLVFFGLPLLTGREVTMSSSGRFGDYLIAFDFFKDNVWFGAYLDKVYYSQNVAFIPHNLFVHPLVMGGIFYFMLFVIFLFSVLLSIRNSDKDLLHSVYICLLGFQFIPSFFSAYFFAVLLGIALASSKRNRLKNKAAYV